MNIQPLHDRVVVRRHTEKVSKGGIIIPQVAEEKALTAEVVAVGPGRWREDERGRWFEPTSVKAGQKVILSPSVNKSWPDIVDSEGCTVINEQDILGVLA